MTVESSKSSVRFFFLFALPLFFLFSYFLLSYYDGGDQQHYRSFYQKIKYLSYFEAFPVAYSKLGAGEPISILVLWFGSHIGIEKDIYISLLNVILALIIIEFVNKRRESFIITTLILFSFYVVVLMTGAERLKIAYILLGLAFVFKSRLRNLFICLSCLAHFQVFLLIPSFLLYSNYESIGRLLRYQMLSKRLAFIFFIGGSFAILTFFFLYEIIISKFNAYFSPDRSLLELLNLSFLLVVGIFSTKNYKRILTSVSPFFVFVFMLGGERVNMLAVTFLIGVLILENRISKPVPMMLLIYFFVKSIPFIQNVIEKGDGFA